jgi:hypothetical protein
MITTMRKLQGLLLLSSLFLHEVVCNDEIEDSSKAYLRRKRLEADGGSSSRVAEATLGNLWDQASRVANLASYTKRILPEDYDVETLVVLDLSMSVTLPPSVSLHPSMTSSPTLAPVAPVPTVATKTPTQEPQIIIPTKAPVPTKAPAPTRAPGRPTIPRVTLAPSLPPTSTAKPTLGRPTSTPTASPTEKPVAPVLPTTTPPSDGTCLEGKSREEYLTEQLAATTSAELLQDSDTPQGKAFDHMVTEDRLFRANPCISTLEQRFALTTLYFATKGESWTRSDSWISDEHECEWFGVSCDKRGSLFATKLELGESCVRFADLAF